ncbi:hypothetical protein H0H87_007460 [Tephrocybe sp. NHM501043]|nr:hypothetical protein H0H87_007460 [Tephrocybe sp. NHM501043]
MPSIRTIFALSATALAAISSALPISDGYVSGGLNRRFLDFTFNIGLNGGASVLGSLNGQTLNFRRPGSEELQRVDIPADKVETISQAFSYVVELANGETTQVITEVTGRLDRRLLDLNFNIGLNGDAGVFGNLNGQVLNFRRPGSEELQRVDIPADKVEAISQAFSYVVELANGETTQVNTKVTGSLDRRLLDLNFNIGLNGDAGVFGNLNGQVLNFRRPGSEELQRVDIPADKVEAISQAFSYVVELANGETTQVNTKVTGSLDRRLLDLNFNIGLNGDAGVFGNLNGQVLNFRRPGSEELQRVDIPADKIEAISQAFSYLVALAA